MYEDPLGQNSPNYRAEIAECFRHIRDFDDARAEIAALRNYRQRVEEDNERMRGRVDCLIEHRQNLERILLQRIAALTAERDEWKERCVARGRDLRVITAERDRWKGMVARLVAAEDRWQETSMNGDLEILYDEFCCARRLLGE